MKTIFILIFSILNLKIIFGNNLQIQTTQNPLRILSTGDPEIIEYFLPCNNYVNTTYNTNFTFHSDLQNFELDDTLGQTLIDQNKLEIHLNIVQHEQFENDLCEIQTITALFTEDAVKAKLVLKINSIIIKENNDTVQGSQRPLVSPQNIEFSDGGLKEIHISNLILEGYNKTIKSQFMDGFYLSNCIVKNTYIFDQSQFTLTHTKNMYVKNSEFYNATCDYKASCNFKANFITYVEWDGCIFDGNTANWFGPVGWIGFTPTVRMYNTIFSNHLSRYHSGNLMIIDVGDYLSVNCTFINNRAQFFGGAFFLQRGDNYTVINGTFIGNSAGERGGCFLTFQSPKKLEIKDCTFHENVAVEGGAVYLAYVFSAYITGSTFIKNKAIGNGGAILQGVNPILNIVNCVFEENEAAQGKGGAVALENVFDVTQGVPYHFILRNNTYNKNWAVSGGGLCISAIPIISNAILEDQYFTENQALQGSGGGLLLESLKMSFQVSNMRFLHNFAKVSGGGLKGSSIKNIELQDLYFQQNKANDGGAMEISLDSENLSFMDVEMDKNIAQSHAGAVKLITTKNITYQNTTITDNNCVSFGGAFYSSRTQDLKILDTTIVNNKAQVGGAIYLHESSNVEFSNILMQENTASNFAGAIRGIQLENLEIVDCQFIRNSAVLEVGALFLQLSNHTYINNSTFESNQGMKSKGCVQIAMQQNLTFQNSALQHNQGNDNSGAIYVFSSQGIQFQNITVQNNTNRGKQGGGITLNKCDDLKIIDSDIQNNKAQEQGGGIQISESNGIMIFDSIISNNFAKQKGGGMIITESSDLELKNLKVNYNEVEDDGAGIIGMNVNNLKIKNTQFHSNNSTMGNGGGLCLMESQQIQADIIVCQNNFALKNGGCMFFQNNKVAIQVKNATIKDNVAQNLGPAIYVDKLDSQLKLESLIVQNHTNSQLGGAIHAVDIEKMELSDSEFKDNSALEKGGALYQKNINQNLIKNTVFDNNFIYHNEQGKDKQQNTFGGTLYIDNSQDVQIISSEILNSFAHLRGGGVYIKNGVKLNISETKLINNAVQYEKNMGLDSKNSDYILSQGGGLYFEPLDQSEIEQSINLQKIQIEKCQASSGGAILVNKNTDQDLKISVKNCTFSQNTADLGPIIRFLGYSQDSPLIEKENIVQNNNEQIFEIKNANNEVQDLGGFYYDYYYNEKRISQKNSQFQLCLQGQFIKQQDAGEFMCKQCLDNGICQGGYKPVLPQKKYWRNSPDSYSFIYCSNNPNVCLGRDQCQEGHVGILCEQCDRINNYSLSKMKLECKLCDTNKGLIVFEMILVFFLVILFIFNQIYGVTRKINKQLYYKIINLMFDLPFYKVNQLSASTKILLLHFQVLYMSINSQVEQFQEFLQNLQFIGNPQTGFSRNLECLITVQKNEDVKMIEYYISFYGLLILISTVVLVIGCEVLCLVFKKFITTKNYLVQTIQSTLIIFLLFVQPGMVQNSMEFLKSRNINGEDYCYANTYIKIDSDIYQNELKPYNITIMVLLGLGLPVTLSVILYRAIKYKYYNGIGYQRKMGILYLEYKKTNIYWEIIIMVLKVLCVVISSVLQDYQAVKGIFIIFILIGYLFLCLKKWPYKTRHLNFQAISSMIVLIVTIGCLSNFFKKNDTESTGFRIFINIVIILINIVFFCYSGGIMIMDFKMAFRSMLGEYLTCKPEKQKQIREYNKKKLDAVNRWKEVKKCIVYTTQEIKSGQIFLEQFPLVFAQNYQLLKQNYFTVVNKRRDMNPISQSDLDAQQSFDNITSSQFLHNYLPKKAKTFKNINNMVTDSLKHEFEQKVTQNSSEEDDDDYGDQLDYNKEITEKQNVKKIKNNNDNSGSGNGNTNNNNKDIDGYSNVNSPFNNFSQTNTGLHNTTNMGTTNLTQKNNRTAEKENNSTKKEEEQEEDQYQLQIEQQQDDNINSFDLSINPDNNNSIQHLNNNPMFNKLSETNIKSFDALHDQQHQQEEIVSDTLIRDKQITNITTTINKFGDSVIKNPQQYYQSRKQTGVSLYSVMNTPELTGQLRVPAISNGFLLNSNTDSINNSIYQSGRKQSSMFPSNRGDSNDEISFL